MRIRGFTRFLLVLFTLVATLIFLFGAAAAAGIALGLEWPSLAYTEGVLTSNLWMPLAACAAFLILALVGLRLLFIRKPREAMSMLLKSTENGTVVIALSALDSMAQRAARKVSGIRDVQTRVSAVDNTAAFKLKVSFMPDVSIPEATVELQNQIKSYVEETSGVAVRDVQIFVDSVQTPALARVE